MRRALGVGHRVAVGLAIVLGSTLAHGQGRDWPGGHLGYGVGGAYVNGTSIRETMDISLDYLHGVQCRGPEARVPSCWGWMISASAVSGFGRSPTYLTLDAGYGLASVLGAHLLAGPAVRLGAAPAFGLDVQAIAYMFVLEVGPRLLVIPSGSQEVQLTMVLGLGFN